MPIYEYKCDLCNHKFEKLQKMSEEPIKVCPNCNGSSVQKLISAAKFRLSGSGWYETDFKSDKENKKNLSSSNDKQDDKKNKDTKSNSDKGTQKGDAEKSAACTAKSKSDKCTDCKNNKTNKSKDSKKD